MKIVFTQKEVEDIVLAHVQRQYGAKVDVVDMTTYSYDFCTVTQSAKLLADMAKPVIYGQARLEAEEKFGGTE
jgi:hypothetical protein